MAITITKERASHSHPHSFPSLTSALVSPFADPFDDQRDELDLLAPTQQFSQHSGINADSPNGSQSTIRLGYSSDPSLKANSSRLPSSSQPRSRTPTGQDLLNLSDLETANLLSHLPVAPSIRTQKIRRNSDPALAPNLSHSELREHSNGKDRYRGGSVPPESARALSFSFQRREPSADGLPSTSTSIRDSRIPSSNSAKRPRSPSPTSSSHSNHPIESASTNSNLNRTQTQSNDGTSSSSPNLQPPTQTTSDAILAMKLSKETNSESPNKPNRSLRQRKAAQLQPYTHEALKYRRELVRNDWQDAVVSQREWQRKEREKQDRRERGEETEQDRLEREEEERKEREQKQKKREESRLEKEERRKVREEKRRLKEEKRLEMEKNGREFVEKLGGLDSDSEEDSSNDDEESQDQLLLADRPASTSKARSKNQNTYGKRNKSSDQTQDKGKGKAKETSNFLSSRNSTPINKANPTPFFMDMDMPLDDPMPTPPPQSQSSSSSEEITTSKRSKSRFKRGIVLSEDESDDGILPVLGLDGPRIRRSNLESDSQDKSNSDSEDENGSDSSIKTSGSFDYNARLKVLKKMIPGNLAKRQVEDLRLMRLEKAYEKAGRRLNRGNDDDEEREKSPSSSASGDHQEAEELIPGQARKVKGKRNQEDGNFDLRDLGDKESESEDDEDVGGRKGISITTISRSRIVEKDLENLNPTEDKLSEYERSLREERELERRRELDDDDDDESDESDEELINYGLQKTSRNVNSNAEDGSGDPGSLETALRNVQNRNQGGRRTDIVDYESSGDEALEVNEYWWNKADFGEDEQKKSFRRKEDDVDRMLRRTKGDTRSRKVGEGSVKPKGLGTSSRSRYGGKRSGGGTHAIRRSGPNHSRNSGGSALQERSLNSRSLSSDEDQNANLNPSRPRDQNKKPKPATGYELPRHFKPRHRPGVFKSNPPVVEMKLRKKLDFNNDDILFNWEARMLNQEARDREKENQEQENRERQDDPYHSDRSPTKRRREGPLNQVAQSTIFTTPARGHHSRMNSNSSKQSPSISTLGRSSINRINPTSNSDNQSPPISIGNRLINRTSSNLSNTLQPTSSTTASPAQVDPVLLAEQLEAQREEADSWNDFKNVRIDFGLKPLNLGVRFDRESYLGKGKLFELISLSKSLRGGDALVRNRMAAIRPNRVNSLGVQLDPNFNEDEIEKVLPDLFDEIFNSAMRICRAEFQDGELGSQEDNSEQSQTNPREERLKIEETFRFLSLWLSSLSNSSINPSHFQTRSGLAFSPVSTANRFTSSLKTQLDHFFDRLRSNLDFTPDHGSELHGLILKFHWFRIELIWRNKMVMKTCSLGPNQSGLGFETQEELNEIDDDDSNEFRTSICRMMRGLMSHGLNKTIRSLKEATTSIGSDNHSDEEMQDGDSQVTAGRRERSSVIEDLTAELWVCLIHLLEEASLDDVFGENLCFWPIYESTLEECLSVQPSRQSLIESETIWYSIFAILNLSQFSSSIGSATSKVHLKSYWSLVLKALSSIQLRLDESTLR